MKIKIKKLNDKAVIPTYAHATDAGLDLTATSIKYDFGKDVFIYGTGLAVEIPEGYVGLVFPRSSNRNTEAYMTNHVGVIDSGYRGEVMVCYKNRTTTNIADEISDIAIDLYDLIDKNNKFSNCDGLAENMSEINKNAVKQPYDVGDRIAQLIIIPYPHIEFEEVDELSDTDRGANGHGSTGR